MSLQFHHFFVFVPRGALLVDELVAAGFSEGSRNSHPGQGTANRRLFFENGMLEFIWAEDLNELSSPLTAPTRLLERSQYLATGFSPFGICVCSSAGTPKNPASPFEGWQYRPNYLPPGISIWEAVNDSAPWEPMIFYLGGVAPFGPEISQREPIHHANGARSILRISVTMREPRSNSDAAEKLKAVKAVELRAGGAAFAEIEIQGSTPAMLDLTQWCPLKIVIRN